VVGDGALAGQVRAALPPGRGAVTGFVNQADLPPYYHAADILVLPSSHEPWGLVVNEAMNRGLAVIATDARLSKAQATKLAQMAQDGLARAIRPVHTPFDGDTVFTLATGRRAGPPLAILGAIAADVVAHAIERSVLEATNIGRLPAARDLIDRR